MAMTFISLMSNLTGGSAEPASPTSASEKTWAGHASYVLGYKRLESDWNPVENQTEVGIVDVDLTRTDWPISLCGQALFTFTEDIPEVSGAQGDASGTWEFNLGARKIWTISDKWKPFLGVGLSVIGASASKFVDAPGGSIQDYEDSDIGLGAWGGAGLYWHFADHWHVGATLQYSWGEVTLFEKRMNAGGFHALGMFGYHW